MPSLRASRSRRRFLKGLPTVIAAGAAAATSEAPAAAQSGAIPADGITSDTLGAAQHIIGVYLPGQERESARPLITRNRDHYESIRKIEIPVETEPAFSFRPPRPRAEGRVAAPAPSRTTRPHGRRNRSLPASLDDLAYEPVTTLAPLVAARRVSSTDLTRMYLARLERHDPTLHCIVTLTADVALAQAAEADREIREGRYRGPLHGIPYGVKDLFATSGVPTTWGAKPYAEQVFDYDATVVTRLREAGAVLLAKLSTGELAVGDLWFRGRTRNPWDAERGSSGSSAGPAAATAAGLVGFAIGTETGGSIISPASTCGVVGLRPTYGRISRYGCMTLRWTLDKVGPLARSVADAGLVLEALHGPDDHDDTVPDLPFRWDARRDIKGLRIGYVEREIDSGLVGDDRQQAAARKPLHDAALAVFREAGATLVPITLPDLPASALYAILNAEAGAMFDELTRSGRINELADQGMNGRANQLRATRFIPAVEYIRAQRIRTLLVRQMNALFETVDVFVAPSQSESVTMTNLTGHPAVVLPAGFVDGLPIGLMLTGRLWDETTLLRAAAAFEHATEWHTKRPAF